MRIVGADLSTKAIDLVAIDYDSDRATWEHYDLGRGDLIERVRNIRPAIGWGSRWDDVLAVGIERPAGRHGVAQVSMAFGALLQLIPAQLLVKPWQPSGWRKAVGLPGNASKDAVRFWTQNTASLDTPVPAWPQDACDAYAVAYATRSVLVVGGGDQTTA